VGGRQISTRSVDPTAYEHVSRALLYEEQERWQDAADELQRAILFDDDAPELHAHLAELFLRLGRDKDAADQVRTSLKLGPSASGRLAEAHVRRAQGDVAGQVAALRQAKGDVEFEAGDDNAEAVYLELAEAQLHTLDLPGAQRTLEELTQGTDDSPGLLKEGSLNDSWGTPFGYSKQGKKFKITSAGPDTEMGSQDDITN